MSLDQLQDAYRRLREKKIERKEIKKSFADELSHNSRYQEILDEMKTLREEKKQIETEAYAQALADSQRLDDLKVDIQSQEQMVSDIALNLFMKNEVIEVRDEYENLYEPSFVVRFKKTGDLAEAKKEVKETGIEKAPSTGVVFQPA